MIGRMLVIEGREGFNMLEMIWKDHLAHIVDYGSPTAILERESRGEPGFNMRLRATIWNLRAKLCDFGVNQSHIWPGDPQGLGYKSQTPIDSYLIQIIDQKRPTVVWGRPYRIIQPSCMILEWIIDPGNPLGGRGKNQHVF